MTDLVISNSRAGAIAGSFASLGAGIAVVHHFSVNYNLKDAAIQQFRASHIDTPVAAQSHFASHPILHGAIATCSDMAELGLTTEFTSCTEAVIENSQQADIGLGISGIALAGMVFATFVSNAVRSRPTRNGPG